jgi:hypothetical protein
MSLCSWYLIHALLLRNVISIILVSTLLTVQSLVDVVSIVRQWKTQLCPSVDPAVCFIISGVLMLMHLHSIDVINVESIEFLGRLRGQKELLRLFVEQFASIWHLPRFLTGNERAIM